MTQKSAKKKSKKSSKADNQASVLGNLRTTRQTRLGGDRRAAAPKPAAAKKAPAAKPKTKRAPKAAAKPQAARPQPAQRPTAPPPARSDGRTSVVTTAVQAAGELAQIGVTVGGQILKRAAGRIPRP